MNCAVGPSNCAEITVYVAAEVADDKNTCPHGVDLIARSHRTPDQLSKACNVPWSLNVAVEEWRQVLPHLAQYVGLPVAA